MNERYAPLEVKVWSPFACFTRPEYKTERVSYDCMTPSAARGVLEAIFWHKPMQWRVREIVVLNPIRRFSMLRNEVKTKMTADSAGLSIVDTRVQRHTLGLRGGTENSCGRSDRDRAGEPHPPKLSWPGLLDVAYIIRADVYLPPGSTDADPAKYRAQFRRHVQRGQCFHRPYLGCREYAAHFCLPNGSEQPIADTYDMGLMLFDFAYGAKQNIPFFFEARLENGVLRVPQELYERGGA